MRRRTAEERYVTQPIDWAWPVTYRFHLALPWGLTQQVLTVDAPGIATDIESTLRMGSVLWERAVAPATTLSTVLTGYDVVAWRFSPAALPITDGLTRGKLAGTPAPRDGSACAVLDTGYLDDLGVTRVPIPGIPSRWVEDGQLGRGAMDALEGWGAMVLMGLCRQLTGSPMQWLVAWNGALDPTEGNPSGVAFRRVEYVYTMHHTRPAPAPSGAPWP